MPPCCVPRGIVNCQVPDVLDITTGVRVVCSNPDCAETGVIHQLCLVKWETTIKLYLQSDTSIKVSDLDSLWNQPLPPRFTNCHCGQGSLKRMVPQSKDSDKSWARISEKMEVARDRVTDGYYGNNDNSWEVVSHANNKGKSRKRKNKKKQSGINPKMESYEEKNDHVSAKKSTEVKKVNSGFVRCCSCHTVHSNLEDFMIHCKSEEHLLQMKVIDSNNEEFYKLKKEVDLLNKRLIEVMKQGIEKDMFRELKQSIAQENANYAMLNMKYEFLVDRIENIESVNNHTKFEFDDLGLRLKGVEECVESISDRILGENSNPTLADQGDRRVESDDSKNYLQKCHNISTATAFNFALSASFLAAVVGIYMFNGFDDVSCCH